MTSVAPPSASPSGRTVASLEHEIKCLVPVSRSVSLRGWLAAVCLPERAHPPALVCTTYYDTPGRAFLGEKIDSDYLKTKVRVRWYATLDGRPDASAVFAEVKYRVGNRREKVRVRLDVDPLDLAGQPLQGPRWSTPIDPLRAFAPHLPARLEPVLSLRYARYRYLDPASAARLTVDDEITVTAFNETRTTGHVPARLPVAIFEYKGRRDDLPPHLAPAVRFGARRGSCSKYLACYQLATGLVL
jgi:hypothetical protein